MSWAAEEFEGIDLGDRRLDSRAVLLLERLANKPTASIPGACHGWGETQAAYRFFAQEEVSWCDILTPHWRCTEARMGAHSVVLQSAKGQVLQSRMAARSPTHKDAHSATHRRALYLRKVGTPHMTASG